MTSDTKPTPDTRRASAPIWRLLKLLKDGGADGVEMSVIKQRLGVTNSQVRNMIYRLRTSEGVDIGSHRRARKDAAYFIIGAATVPTGGTEKILRRLKDAKPLGVSGDEFRALMSSATLRRALSILNRAKAIVSKHAGSRGSRYWLTAEDRDAQLAEEAKIAPKPVRCQAQKAPSKPRAAKATAPAKKVAKPRMTKIPPRTGPQGEVSYLANYVHTKAKTPPPRFETKDAPAVFGPPGFYGTGSAWAQAVAGNITRQEA